MQGDPSNECHYQRKIDIVIAFNENLIYIYLENEFLMFISLNIKHILFYTYINYYIYLLIIKIIRPEANHGAGAQSVTVNRLVVGWIPTRGHEIFTLIYISVSSL